MAKLYPPQIGGTIPAFYEDYLSDGSLKPLTIPFIMNKTVSKSEITGFSLMIKTVANSKYIGTVEIVNTATDKMPPWNFTKGEAYFNIPLNGVIWRSLHIGQYYKVQLAYLDKNGNTGYYSSVGIMKFTTKPDVNVENMVFGEVNMNENIYVGTYSQKRISDTQARDVSEKVYSYCFNVYDANGDLYDTSGEQLHNSFEDENAFSSRDMFTLNKELIVNKNYYIQYEVTTNNNAHFKSTRYRIMQKETIDPEIKARLQVDLNSDHGYVNVRLIGEKDENGVEYKAAGSFVLKRGCSKDNYTVWDSISTFRLNGHLPSRWLWKDLTIEHGYHYKYSLQQFNDSGLYSNKLYSNEIYASFEDSFLYDGEKQLRLKFNPKVSSFKEMLLETKTNTIGSKYPFIFRNGKVRYKEFPISGLISYQLDDEELFISKDELFLNEVTTDLTDNNVAAERIFKLKVLEFFNNGKPKIFRSPAEGNYIVRLMNTSMTPDDKLSRMLHTISTTASEVSDFSYEALLEYGFLQLIDTKIYVTRWESIPMVVEDDFGKVRYRNAREELLNYSPATSLTFENVRPGSKFEITNELNETDIITIGTTGVYNLDFGMRFISVKTISADLDQGSLIYSYESNDSNVFDTIEDVNIHDYPLIQFVGENDVISAINDNIKTSLLDFTYLRFNKRAVETLYARGDGHYFWNKECTSLAPPDSLEPFYIYKIHNVLTKEDVYVDGRYPLDILKNYSNIFKINGASIDLTETEYYELIKPEKITELKIPSGISLECAYQTKELIYSLESKNAAVKAAKEAYITALNNYQTLLNWEDVDNNYYTHESGYSQTYFNALAFAYDALFGLNENGENVQDIYFRELKKAVDKQKEDNDYYGK